MKDSIANKLVNFINSCINNFVIIILIFLFLISSYAIFDKYQVYEDAKISQDVEDLRPKDNDVTFSLPELRKLNPEIHGWLKINKTNIDYPLVKGNDNTKYLTHNYKDEDTGVGSIFMDFRNDPELNDDYTIVYGHNLQANLMFSGILKYKSKKYFKSHLNGELHTMKGDYRLDIFAYALIDASKEDVEIYNLMDYRNNSNDKIIQLIKNRATQYKDIDINSTDKLILLSTCDSTGTYNRSVLLARLRKETDVLTSITTKASKLANGELDTVEEEPYEAPLVKEEPEQTIPKEKFTISTYTLVLILTILIVVIIYAVLLFRRSKVKKKKSSASQENPVLIPITPNNNSIPSIQEIPNSTTITNTSINTQNTNNQTDIQNINTPINTPVLNNQNTINNETQNNNSDSDII